MKIIFATGIFPPDIGGPATSVSMLAEAWSAKGHDVSVVTYSDAADDGHKRPYRVQHILRSQPLWRRYLAFAKTLWRVADRPGPIFAQDGIASGLPALLVARVRGHRLILRIAGDYAWEQAQVRHGYRESLETFQKELRLPPGIWILRALQRFVYRRADRVIAPSRYLAGVLRGWRVPEERIRVIYNGVHAIEISEPIARHPHRIVAAARMVPWKNIDVLIKAMTKILEHVPDASMLLIGDGPELSHLKALASAPMLRDRVQFVGRLTRDAVCRAFAESDVFVLPSSYEGFSHQLVEAFACGTVVVASRAGGNTELVEDGKNGLLVEPGDVDGAAQAIIRMLTDRAFAARCAAEAKKDLARFGVEAQIRETTEEIIGAVGTRVVLVSRDGTAADPDSRTAARMRLYGERVERLRVVCLAKREAASVTLSDQVRVEVIDVRKAAMRPWTLVRGVRQAIRAEGANLVTAQDPFEAGLVALWAARKERVPLIVEEHGGVFLSEHWKNETLKNRLLYALGLRVLRRADALRAVSMKIEADLRRRFPKKPIERIPVFSERRSCRSAGASHMFGYVGRFVPQKNLYGLLAAFRHVAKQLPAAHLLMAGGGPLEHALKARAVEEGIAERVDWIPHNERVDEIYALMGTLVLPSFYEGWGRVVPEAMSCGVPVVMTDVGCANELMRNGVDGYVVPVGDDAVLAKAMLAISDPWQHRMMSAASAQRVSSLETPDVLADRLTDFWKRVIDGSVRP